MIARRKERLEALAAELKEKYGTKSVVIQADLSKNDFISTVIPEITSLNVGLLVNNAGFGDRGAFLSSNLERELDMINVNCRAPLLLAHLIGRQMSKRKKSGMIFLSSVLGFAATPFFANYAASKAYNLYLGEALWYELKQHGIDVMSLSPGVTRTEFGSGTGLGALGAMEVEPVVEEALNKLGKSASVVTGIHNKFFVAWFKMMPRKLLLTVFGAVMARMRKFRT